TTVQGQGHLLEVVRDWVRAAASRTFCTAGTSRAIKMAMMAITTNNSMSVKARTFFQNKARIFCLSLKVPTFPLCRDSGGSQSTCGLANHVFLSLRGPEDCGNEQGHDGLPFSILL